MKSKGVILLVALLTLVSLASAINLEIEEKAINDVVIVELDTPALFSFTIKNLGQSDGFEIYSLVGVDIFPKSSFNLETGETKKINVKVIAGESVKKNPGYFTFVYKIKGANTGIQEERLTMKIVNLKDALQLSADNIDPESEQAIIHIENKENFNFENIEAEFSSVFFSFSENFSLSSLEKKSFTQPLNREKLKALMAGPYILDASIKVNGVEETLGSTIKFLEQSGLSKTELKEGFFIIREEIEKKNEGNTAAVAEITMEKGIFSRLFTTLSIQPNKIERQGFKVLYTWQQELRPNESLKVVTRTNWLIPILVIIAIVALVILYQIYLTSDIILKKKINFVKTKGGEFALKVSVSVKAKRFVEKINVIDKLPPIVKLYERYGTIAPDRVDEKNRRIEWNIESLDEGEDRLLSYIVYSKIGVLGKFELPPSKAIYEKEGKIKETQSNRVFFISEPKKIKKVEN